MKTNHPCPKQYFKKLIRPATVRIYHATFGMIVFVLAMTTVALATYSNWFRNRDNIQQIKTILASCSTYNLRFLLTAQGQNDFRVTQRVLDLG